MVNWNKVSSVGLYVGSAMIIGGLVGIIATSPKCRTLHVEHGESLGSMVDRFQEYFPEVVIPQQVMQQNSLRYDYNGFGWVVRGDQDLTYCRGR